MTFKFSDNQHVPAAHHLPDEFECCYAWNAGLGVFEVQSKLWPFIAVYESNLVELEKLREYKRQTILDNMAKGLDARCVAAGHLTDSQVSELEELRGFKEQVESRDVESGDTTDGAHITTDDTGIHIHINLNEPS